MAGLPGGAIPGLCQRYEDSETPNVPINVLGLSYHTAGLHIRGRVGFTGVGLNSILQRFIEAGFEECMALSTCNRTEIYYVGGCREEAERLLVEESELSFEDLSPYLYSKSGSSAARHLFAVASGLDSAVLGETEILAQLKDAVSAARAMQTLGRHIDFVVRSSQTASRRVRTETEICRNVTSIGSLAVRDASARTGGLTDKTVVVIGAGKIAERIAKDLVTSELGRLIFVNRTIENAAGLALRYGGEAKHLRELEEILSEADVVFGATSCEHPVLTEEIAKRLSRSRQGRSLTVVDLGVPENIQKSIAALPDFDVLEMEELVSRCAANSQRRVSALPAALEILEEELSDYLTECSKRAASSTIATLVQYTDEVRENNLNWANERLAHLSPKDLKIVADLTTRMVRGFLQSPIRELKEELPSPHSHEIVTKLFRSEAGGGQDR